MPRERTANNPLTPERQCSSHENDEETCETSQYGCCILCYILMFLLCIVEMRTRTRIVLTWLYVLVAAIVVGTLVRHSHDKTSYQMSYLDMRPLDDISTTYCRGVSLITDSMLDVYRFENKPKLSDVAAQPDLQDFRVDLHAAKYTYWLFYFLKGSRLIVSVCGRQGSTFLYFENKANFSTRWTPDRLCRGYNCYVKESYYHCNGNSRLEFTFTAPDDDEYYLVILNDAVYSRYHIRFYITRNVYNITEATQVCLAENACSIDLHLKRSETLVAVDREEDSFGDTLTTTCHPRYSMYILIFGFFPFLCGILCTYIVIKCRRKRRTSELRNGEVFTVMGSGDLQGISNDGYDIQMRPPNYEDVVPPSYEDVLEEKRRQEQTGSASMLQGVFDFQHHHHPQQQQQS
ncbi:uncharacterized protein LOC128219982 [Mya arenaria]|uniref:uncharacterized protein LOC128219982 n=1 Tax=Mya arenaria TaxID=6604 RepID=UPI0022E08468|nr:uncharacterized protein LOC128219982 [Mya arenaria]